MRTLAAVLKSKLLGVIGDHKLALPASAGSRDSGGRGRRGRDRGYIDDDHHIKPIWERM